MRISGVPEGRLISRVSRPAGTRGLPNRPFPALACRAKVVASLPGCLEKEYPPLFDSLRSFTAFGLPPPMSLPLTGRE
jgi:hypothetical protein